MWVLCRQPFNVLKFGAKIGIANIDVSLFAALSVDTNAIAVIRNTGELDVGQFANAHPSRDHKLDGEGCCSANRVNLVRICRDSACYPGLCTDLRLQHSSHVPPIQGVSEGAVGAGDQC